MDSFIKKLGAFKVFGSLWDTFWTPHIIIFIIIIKQYATIFNTFYKMTHFFLH